jgi:hypothetical protein
MQPAPTLFRIANEAGEAPTHPAFRFSHLAVPRIDSPFWGIILNPKTCSPAHSRNRLSPGLLG